MKKPSCSCGAQLGKTIILNGRAHVGVITEYHDNGTFRNNRALYLELNFCPQCGSQYLIDGQMSFDFSGDKIAMFNSE